MSRDFNDIYKKIDQSHKDLYKKDTQNAKDILDIKKDQDKLLREISDLKKEVKDISFKVDVMLEILNSFTIMLEEESQDDYGQDDDDTDENWLTTEDDWSNGEDDS